METYNDIWLAVLDYCKTESDITQVGFDTWLEPIKFSGFENNVVFLSFSSEVKKKIVKTQYGELLQKAFNSVLGFEVQIEYDYDPTIFIDVSEKEKEHKEIEEINTNYQFTFETFIEGPSNKFAYRAAMAVAEDPGGHIKQNNAYGNYNPLFIYGKSGLGKTHILNAICYEIRKNFPEMRILYVRAEDFANEFINALGKKTVDEFHSKFRNIDVLLIDDVQFIGGKERTEEEFFHTFNSLIENGKQIVLTSDRPPKEIQSLTERLCSRFENGLLADIQSPEYETRCAIIKNKAKLLNFKISDDVVNYIADKINLCMLIGIFVVFLFFFRFSLTWFVRYFRQVDKGLDALLNGQEQEIVLSPELEALEKKLNLIHHTLEKRELEAKLAEQRKNDLVMYLAHDIRTPLTSVIGYLNLLEEAPEMPAEQRAKYVHITLEKAYRLETLVNEFFEITRYNLQQIILEKESIDLSYMLIQLTDEFYPILSANDNKVELQAEEELHVSGDPAKLARVFQNVLQNACTYSARGTTITIRAIREQDMLSISFENQGRTIPKEKLQMIFEKFYRLDESRGTSQGGAGLGLAIAKEIVTLHSGTITAESEAGRTVFSILLPAS